jgi:hypothetical protein
LLRKGVLLPSSLHLSSLPGSLRLNLLQLRLRSLRSLNSL